MPFCTNCGTRLPSDALFCPNCGRSRTTIAPERPRVKRSHFKRNAAILVMAILIGPLAIEVITPISSNPYTAYPVYDQGTLRTFLRNQSRSAPTGMGAFGLENSSGSIRPYIISTDQVISEARISAIGAHNSSLPPDFLFEASLQLNVMLMVNTSTTTQAYWLQDVITFDTLQSLYLIHKDLAFNLTDRNSTNDAAGLGQVSKDDKGELVYTNNGGISSYSLPTSAILGISVKKVYMNGVAAGFYFSSLGEPSYIFNSNNEFDNVSLMIPNISSAAIVVTPYRLVLGYLSYDAEFAWGGPCCGYGTIFTKMNSSLSLWYVNESSGQLSNFPAYFSFGADTGEFASNLSVSPDVAGVHVVTGHQDNRLVP